MQSTPETVVKPAPSMLDEWTAPVPKPKVEAPKAEPPSMLEQWTVPAQSSTATAISKSEEQKTPTLAPSGSTSERSSFLANPTMPTSMPNSADDEAKPDDTASQVRDEVRVQPESKQEEEDAAQREDFAPQKHDVKEDKKVEESYKMPKELKQPPPEAFKEPDPNSLLDAFGF